MELIGTRIILQDDDVEVSIVFEIVSIGDEMWLVCVNNKVKMRIDYPRNGDAGLRVYQTALWLIAHYLEHVAMLEDGDVSLN